MRRMSGFLGKLPLLLEVLVNGAFVALYTFHKTNSVPDFLAGIPMSEVNEYALLVVPLVLFTTLASNFLKSEGIEDFIRRYIFSLIIFVPLIITWGDLEFLYWLSAVHLFSSVISLNEKDKTQRRGVQTASSFIFRLKLQPTQVVMLSFAGLILLGSLVLMLPVSTVAGKSISFIDALFTATSAACVTGLSTISVLEDLSIFGQVVVLVLVQMGGLGIMTLSSSMALIMGRNLQIREQVIMQDVLDTSSAQELMSLVVDIIKFTFVIEFVGAIILTVGFHREGFEIGQAIYFGFFHSIMSFCNAGMTLFSNNYEDFKFVPMIHSSTMILLMLGGVGFTVLKDFQTMFTQKRSFRSLSTHTKLVVSINLFLWGFAAIYLFFGEFLNAFQDMNMWERIQVSLFQATSSRTAGFNTVNIHSLHPHTIYMMLLLMFIGGAPGGTGGGVKVTTFAILLQSVTATLRGKSEVEFFERRVPQATVVKSIAIFIICLILVSGGILVMLRLEPDKSFLALFFEVTSAFSTAGLSLGITPFLSIPGKLVLISMMYLGRVGPLTLVLAVGSRVVLPKKVNYPESKILIG